MSWRILIFQKLYCEENEVLDVVIYFIEKIIEVIIKYLILNYIYIYFRIKF